jgi:hypothetical protein
LARRANPTSAHPLCKLPTPPQRLLSNAGSHQGSHHQDGG